MSSDTTPPNELQVLPIAAIREQSKNVLDVVPETNCSQEQRADCATKYGANSVDNKILISISSTINDMAASINSSEIQKSEAREKHMKFFRTMLIALLAFVAMLIVFNGCSLIPISISLEIFVSVIIVILADIFAIIQSFVKYMNSLDHYKAYNDLIDSLLKHINRQTKKPGGD